MQEHPCRKSPNPHHHLVVLREPYLGRMLAGRKRVECRLSTQLKPPHAVVQPDDLLWLKPPCRPVCAVARVGHCEYWNVSSESELFRRIDRHRLDIAAEPEFWHGLDWVRYVSLIWVHDVLAVEPISVVKSDRRAWVVMNGPPRPNMVV